MSPLFKAKQMPPSVHHPISVLLFPDRLFFKASLAFFHFLPTYLLSLAESKLDSTHCLSTKILAVVSEVRFMLQ